MIFNLSRLTDGGEPLSSLPEGALVAINENGSLVNFYLAKHDYESALNGAGRTLLVRKDCYDLRQWHTSSVNEYSASNIDSWLNGTYKGLLDPAMQEAIGTTAFRHITGYSSGNQVTTLQRSVFLLSYKELGWPTDSAGRDSHVDVDDGSTELGIVDTLKIAYFEGTAVNQWTRTPHTCSYAKYVAAVGKSGYTVIHNYCDAADTNYSRPAFTLSSEMSVNPEPNADGSYTLIEE